MKHRILIAALASFLLSGALPSVAAPPLINYQGRIVVGTTNFNSPPNGLFKFALVNADGTASYWSNAGNTPIPMEPLMAVSLPVTKGLYSVLLGDTTIPNMAPIPTSAFTQPDLRLRVWFSDGTPTGFQLLTPDQRLAPTAYLADGIVSSASIADGSIISSKVATGAITADAIAGAAINISHLSAEWPIMAGQVLSYNGTDIAWADPGGTGAGWSLSGNAGTDGTSFLGTTDDRNLILKTNNVERMRLTTSGDLLLQIPADFPSFTVRNGLGVYGLIAGGFGGGRTFAGTDVRGPVLYGQSGGGLGLKSSTNVETLALRWDSAGKVGIGTPDPIAKLHLSDSGSLTHLLESVGPNGVWTQTRYKNAAGEWAIGTTRDFAGNQFYIYRGTGVALGIQPNGDTIATGDLTGTRLILRSDTDAPANAAILCYNAAVTTFVPFSKANNRPLSLLVRDASVRQLTIYGGADLAEPFHMKEGELEKGSVVVIDEERPGRLKRSTGAYDRRVAGIVSGADGLNPGIALHQEGVMEGGQNVALSGRVYVRADATGAPIKPGDLLTTSDTPGHAMKVTEHNRAQGAVIGKAMSSLDEGTGMVLVLVTLQ